MTTDLLLPPPLRREAPERPHRGMSVPLLDRSDHGASSAFRPENMLREARRQKGLPQGCVPPVCVLDPDGDIVDFVKQCSAAIRSPNWACYHTQMWQWSEGDEAFGIVGYAVGGPFAVLVAEQLFACGCQLLISVASAGQIAPDLEPPCYILIERALRDEGTSHHYLPATAYAEADRALYEAAYDAMAAGCRIRRGDSWTTDAPFRETFESIAARQEAGILAVEMEAAALYAFGRACDRPVLCLAHVTNQLGCVEGDFEKGDENGACGSLDLIRAIARGWRRAPPIATPDLFVPNGVRP